MNAVQVWSGQFRGKKVAIKQLDPNNMTKQMLNNFIKELNIMSSFRHPNIVLFMVKPFARMISLVATIL